MATDPQARQMIRDLEKRVALIDNATTGTVRVVSDRVTTLEGSDSQQALTLDEHRRDIGALKVRVTRLEQGTPPEAPGPGQPPVAAFTCTPNPANPLECTLDGTSSTGMVPLGYQWDLDDQPAGVMALAAAAVMATGPVVTVIYPAPGPRTIVLTVTDAHGLTDTATEEIIVEAPDEPEPPEPEPQPTWSALEPVGLNARLCEHQGVLHEVADFGRGTIAHRKSADQGKTWSVPVAIAGADVPAQYYALAAEGSDLYLLTANSGQQVHCHRSPDLGATWRPRVQITGTWPEGNCRVGAVAVGGLIHAVIGRWDGVNYWRSADKGATWAATFMAGENGACTPAIDAEGQTVHVVWATNVATDHESYYRRSTDGGLTWGTVRKLTSSEGGHPSIRPRVVAMDGKVIVAYQEETAFQSAASLIEQWCIRSEDGGTTWLPPQQLTAAGQHYTHATLDRGAGGDVHLTFVDSPGTDRPYYMRSKDYGATWEPPQLIGDVNGHPFNVAASADFVHVVMVPIGATPFSYTRRALAGTPTPPEPPPNGGEHGDLYALNLATVADNNALKSKWVLYEGDAVIGQNLNLVTENGVKRQRHDFDRRGLSCANDVSCQCGNPRFAPQQEVYTRLRFATSPNWKAYDEACAAQGDTVGDMKLSFIDTVGGMSGRSGGILSHNNAQPGYPQGSIYMEESLPPKAPGVASRGEWIGVTFAPGVVYEIRHRWKYSTTSTSNDGHNEVWIYRVEASGSLTLMKNWKQTGFSTRGDTEDQPERTDGGSICHNQSTGPAIKMWIDVFEYDIWSAANKPSWASR